MKKVNRCFGRYGERINCSLFCNDEFQCRYIYFTFFKKYFNHRINRLRYYKLNEEIENFMKKRGMKFKDERNIHKTKRK